MKRVCPVHLADESVTVFHMIGLIAWLCLQRKQKDRKPNYVACSARLVGQVGGSNVRCKVLLRAGWNHMFCIPGFENVSPGEGSDWVKETHC